MANSNSTIKFGTDGWRGIIADDFTFENVKKVSLAVASYLKKGINNPKIVVGYDTRFLSDRFSRTVADSLASRGCNVILSKSFLSTPAVSCSVVKKNADLGIVISASHNPPEFCGFKIKAAKGCSSPESLTKEVEVILNNEQFITSGESNGKVGVENLLPLYFSKLKKTVDFSVIKKSTLKCVVDPMYGAGIGYMTAILKGTKCTPIEIHNAKDPMFGGLHPEPIESELCDLKKAVIANKAAVGLATDGDADRIGVVDEKGNYITPHQIFPLLLYYLCKYKKQKGKVVQALSLGYLSERIAKDFNLPFEETPIGFKYIADKIINEDVLIGGEESGGYGYGNYIPERDGILNSLMIMEMLANTGKKLSALVKEVESKYGTSRYVRTDFRKPAKAMWTKEEFVKQLRISAPAKIDGLKVVNIKDYDGIEFVLEDDSWLLLRPSGTEPVIRVYCESCNIKQAKRIIECGSKAVAKLI